MTFVTSALEKNLVAWFCCCSTEGLSTIFSSSQLLAWHAWICVHAGHIQNYILSTQNFI